MQRQLDSEECCIFASFTQLICIASIYLSCRDNGKAKNVVYSQFLRSLTPADEMNACLKNSNLWAHVKILKLTTNMRVRLQNDDSGQTVDSISGRIQLPADFCNLVTSKNELIEKVFPNILKNYKNDKWLSERAILAPKNIDVHEINNIVLTKIRDQAVLYKSVDTVLEPNEAVNYPSEFLNSIDPSGFPPHVLQLKIGVPIILLRNINPPKLCNGTRLAVKKKFNTALH